MLTLSDENFDAIELAEGALILNQMINPQTKVEWAQATLQQLLEEARLALRVVEDEKERFERFLQLFYQEWGFRGDQEEYFKSHNAFLDQVLERRKGIPLSLGALILYFGRKLGFPLQGIAFPTQFILSLSWPNEAVMYLNPFTGEYLSRHTLQAWLIGHQGPLANLREQDLQPSDYASIIGRWLALLKNVLIREEHYTLALRCTDLALTFVPDDPYEIRDRGFIYQQLHCHHVAIQDYRYFIEQCPDDPAAELLKMQLLNLTQHNLTLH